MNVGVRPEDLKETAGEDFVFEGVVDIYEALGEVTLLYFHPEEEGREPVIGKLHGIHANVRGQTVRMAADPRQVHVFKDGVSLLYR